MFHWQVSVPPNTSAIVQIPAQRVEDVTESGVPVAQARASGSSDCTADGYARRCSHVVLHVGIGRTNSTRTAAWLWSPFVARGEYSGWRSRLSPLRRPHAARSSRTDCGANGVSVRVRSLSPGGQLRRAGTGWPRRSTARTRCDASAPGSRKVHASALSGEFPQAQQQCRHHPRSCRAR